MGGIVRRCSRNYDATKQHLLRSKAVELVSLDRFH